MKCPTCGTELRTLQVETMIGNPECNEWCRNGYCSHQCFIKRDPTDKPAGIRERGTPREEAMARREPIPASTPRELDSYTLATACLATLPFALLIVAIGSFTGVYQYPQVALGFLILTFAILVAGFVSGIVALFGIRKHGRQGILWTALIGMLLIAGYVALAVLGIIKAPSKQAEAEQGVGGQAEGVSKIVGKWADGASP